MPSARPVRLCVSQEFTTWVVLVRLAEVRPAGLLCRDSEWLSLLLTFGWSGRIQDV